MVSEPYKELEGEPERLRKQIDELRDAWLERGRRMDYAGKRIRALVNKHDRLRQTAREVGRTRDWNEGEEHFHQEALDALAEVLDDDESA